MMKRITTTRPISRSNHARRSIAFTLIELLIVIAIIAILALIAVPNFLEAQVRAKVSRTMADMRSIATALEAYAVDWGNYPEKPAWPQPGWDDPGAWLTPLTTPVAFMSSLPQYPWQPIPITIGGKKMMIDYYDYKDRSSWDRGFAQWGGQHWWIYDPGNNHRWALFATGPDAQYKVEWWLDEPGANYLPYDASNGTMSEGDLIRLGP